MNLVFKKVIFVLKKKIIEEEYQGFVVMKSDPTCVGKKCVQNL